MRNQNGAALIVVLLIITVFFVLSLSIISSALSNSKQVNKTEQEMQAVDLAEMGVLHYKQHFMDTTYKLLKLPIETAVDNPENKTLDEKVTDAYDNLDKQDLINALLNYKELYIR